jgi:hypothetical protein
MHHRVPDTQALEHIARHSHRLEQRFAEAQAPDKALADSRLLEYCWVLQQSANYLTHTPAAHINTIRATQFCNNAPQYLSEQDILQILNLVPTSEVELHAILGDRINEQQQSELLQLIRQTLEQQE